MIGSRSYSKLGLLGPIDDLKAQIQGYVAEFLACRTKLNEMTKSPVLTIADKANELLANQGVLEPQLQTSLALIDKIQMDAYSMSDITTIAAFVPSMVSQINNTNDLWNEYQGLGSSAKPPTSWLLYGILGLVGYWFFRRKKLI
jgi:hypothetical protein